MCIRSRKAADICFYSTTFCSDKNETIFGGINGNTRKIYETNGAEETFEVGMRLAKEAKAGDIYCLDGDLGTGKLFFPVALPQVLA